MYQTGIDTDNQNAFIFIFVAAVDDFMNPNPFNITFTGTTSACINISTIDDTDFEDDHSFTVLIDSTTPSITVGAPSAIIATLMDNEGLLHVLLSWHLLYRHT